jgi:hypothetical protein
LRLVIPTAARRGVSVQGKPSADRGRQTADRALRVARARPCLSDAIEGRGPGVRDRATEQETRASLAARRVGNAPPAKPTLDAHDRSWLHCSP